MKLNNLSCPFVLRLPIYPPFASLYLVPQNTPFLSTLSSHRSSYLSPLLYVLKDNTSDSPFASTTNAWQAGHQYSWPTTTDIHLPRGSTTSYSVVCRACRPVSTHSVVNPARILTRRRDGRDEGRVGAAEVGVQALLNYAGVRVATDAMSDRKKYIPRNVAHRLSLAIMCGIIRRTAIP